MSTNHLGRLACGLLFTSLSRIMLAELGPQRQLRTKELDVTHKRRTDWWAPILVMAVVAVAFLASVCMAVAGDPKTGLPDKPMGIITAIVAGGVGYITGKAYK